MIREQVYAEARALSLKLRDEQQQTAEAEHDAAMSAAGDEFRAVPFKHQGTLDHYNAVTAQAGDIRQATCDLASTMHQDRLAALAKHFEQAYRGPGNPDDEHAQKFVAALDPHCVYGPVPSQAPPPHELVNHNGVVKPRPVVEVVGKRLVGGHTAIAPGSDPVRSTFAPANSEEFMSAKRAGIFGSMPEIETVPTAPPEATPQDQRSKIILEAEDRLEIEPVTPPPPGLLEDIAQVLARTAKK